MADPKHIAELRARVDALKADDRLEAEDARQLMQALDVTRQALAGLRDQVVVGVRMSRLTYRYLESLKYCERGGGYDSVENVIQNLVESAADGIRRPGSWERQWLLQAFGDEPQGKPDESGYGVQPYRQPENNALDELAYEVGKANTTLDAVRDAAMRAQGSAPAEKLVDEILAILNREEEVAHG